MLLPAFVTVTIAIALNVILVVARSTRRCLHSVPRLCSRPLRSRRGEKRSWKSESAICTSTYCNTLISSADKCDGSHDLQRHLSSCCYQLSLCRCMSAPACLRNERRRAIRNLTAIATSIRIILCAAPASMEAQRLEERRRDMDNKIRHLDVDFSH